MVQTSSLRALYQTYGVLSLYAVNIQKPLYHPGFIPKVSINGSKFYFKFLFLVLAHTTLREFYFILFFLFVEYEWHLISILLLDTFYPIKIYMIIFYNIYYYISYFILLVLDLRVTFIFPLFKTNVFLLW